MTPPGGPCARPALARPRPGRPAQRPTSMPSSSSTTTATYVWFMRARIWSAACCISSSGSRIAAIRWATDERSPICSARWRLSASARRSASFAALHLARPLGRPRPLLLRLDQPARRLVLLRDQQRLEPLVAELVEGDERLGERLAVRAGAQQHRGEAAVQHPHVERVAEEARAPPDLALGPPASASSRPSTSPSGQPVEQRVERARAPSRASASAIPAHLRHRPHPVAEHRVAAPATAIRPRAGAPAPAASRGFSPRCRHAIPRVSRSMPHVDEPGLPHERGERLGLGNFATEAGRYA